MEQGNIFEAEIICAYSEWKYCDVTLRMVCFNKDGVQIEVLQVSNSSGAGSPHNEDIWLSLKSLPCEYAKMNIIITPNQAIEYQDETHFDIIEIGVVAFCNWLPLNHKFIYRVDRRKGREIMLRLSAPNNANAL